MDSRIIGTHDGCGGEVAYTSSPSYGVRSCMRCGDNSMRGDPVVLDVEATYRDRANWRVVANETDEECLVIEDVGPHDRYRTITNAAERVVEEVVASGALGGRRLLYYDTDRRLDELVMRDGKFYCFAPGPRTDARK